MFILVKFVFSFLLLLGSLQGISQKVFCPLKNMEIIKNDTLINILREPTIGIELKSKSDSLFSIYEGTIIDYKDYSRSKHSITVLSKNKIEVVYFFLKYSPLKVGDKVNQGQFIGIMNFNNKEKYSLLSIVIKKNKISQSKRFCYEIINDCIKKE